jgi:hypothetical protein
VVYNRALRVIGKEEDRKVFESLCQAALAAWKAKEDKKVMEDIEGAYGPGMLKATVGNYGYGQEHKAFPQEEFRRGVSRMRKDDLIDALVNEAEMRYDADCRVQKLMGQLSETEAMMERQESNFRSKLTHWQNAASHLSQAISALVLER